MDKAHESLQSTILVLTSWKKGGKRPVVTVSNVASHGFKCSYLVRATENSG